MRNHWFGLILVLLAFLFSAAACSPAPAATPDANVPVTMENVCEYDGQVVELEGELILPNSVSCSSEEPAACQMQLFDPFREIALYVDIPVYDGEEALPVNRMYALPDPFDVSDFVIRTANDRLAGDRNLVSIRGEVNSSRSGNSCSLINVESITRLDALLYVGVDLKRVTLQEALTEGLVLASITGDGLTRIDLTLKPQVDFNLEIEIEPGTTFISGSAGVQNMVLRRETFVYLKPSVEVSLELEVSCANMELKQPEGADAFTVSTDPPNPDLAKLFALDRFQFEEIDMQQFAVWTVTDNPPNGGYTGIDSDGVTHLPWEDDIARMLRLFEAAGIDPTKYRVFSDN